MNFNFLIELKTRMDTIPAPSGWVVNLICVVIGLAVAYRTSRG